MAVVMITETNRQVNLLQERVGRLEEGAPPAPAQQSAEDKTELEAALKYANEMKVVMSSMGTVCAILAGGCAVDANVGTHMVNSAKLVLHGLNTQMEGVFCWTPEQRRVVYESMQFGSFVDKLGDLDGKKKTPGAGQGPSSAGQGPSSAGQGSSA